MNSYLKSLQERTGALSIYIIDNDGNIISSSDFGRYDSAIGSNVLHRPYFINSDGNNTVGYFGVGVSNGIPGYFSVNSISWNGVKVGAISVKINLDALINTRGGVGETILLDRHKIIASSSNPNWFYHSISPFPQLQHELISEKRKYHITDISILDYKKITKINYVLCIMYYVLCIMYYVLLK